MPTSDATPTTTTPPAAAPAEAGRAVDGRRRRRTAALATLPVTGLGLLAVLVGRATGGPAHALADLAGDALFAVLAYAVLTVLAPRAPRAVVAGVAFAACAALELLQLTGVPASLAERAWAWRLVLGTTFAAADLAAYAVGAVGAWLVERRHTSR